MIVAQNQAKSSTSSSSASPIPKSPSYHSGLDQAGAKEFTFFKTPIIIDSTADSSPPSMNSLATMPPTIENKNGSCEGSQASNMLLNNLKTGSPIRARDRNAFSIPSPNSAVQLPLLRGAEHSSAGGSLNPVIKWVFSVCCNCRSGPG